MRFSRASPALPRCNRRSVIDLRNTLSTPHSYWHHAARNESVWVKPEPVAEESLLSKVSNAFARFRPSAAAAAEHAALDAPITDGWAEAEDDAGNKYYTHVDGRPSVWVRPVFSRVKKALKAPPHTCSASLPAAVESISSGADSSSSDVVANPMYIAAQNGNVAELEQLLVAGGADMNTTVGGATPLYIAVQKGHGAVVERLLNAGADANRARADNGATPLFHATYNGQRAIVELLLAAGANVEMGKEGTTPLFIAVQKKLPSVAQLLISAGANVNTARATDGSTPLYIAAQCGHAAMVALLLQRGADKSIPNREGHRPREIAQSSGHDAIAALLSVSSGSSSDDDDRDKRYNGTSTSV